MVMVYQVGTLASIAVAFSGANAALLVNDHYMLRRDCERSETKLALPFSP